jgi:hypothetical protein
MNARVNPLSRRPAQKRLVVAVRGAAGTGKSYFAASLADAGVGRLCFFDVERKSRLLPGATGASPRYDALEIHHPDELPDFIDWALDGEGKAQGYGAYALDSWSLYFARKHRETLKAVRERTGDVTAQPTADQLQDDQVLYQEVLRRLCMDSGACVVITDHIAAKGKEQVEENELGQVVPITRGGLEYFIDVMLELSLRVDGFETKRVGTVIKSNSDHFPIGLEIEDPSFKALLDRMDELPAGTPDDIPEFLKVQEEVVEAGPTLEDVVRQAESYGLNRAKLLLAAKSYHKVSALEQLSAPQRADLLARMAEKFAATGALTKGAKRPYAN